jgi:hypothetical protein
LANAAAPGSQGGSPVRLVRRPYSSGWQGHGWPWAPWLVLWPRRGARRTATKVQLRLLLLLWNSGDWRGSCWSCRRPAPRRLGRCPRSSARPCVCWSGTTKESLPTTTKEQPPPKTESDALVSFPNLGARPTGLLAGPPRGAVQYYWPLRTIKKGSVDDEEKLLGLIIVCVTAPTRSCPSFGSGAVRTRTMAAAVEREGANAGPVLPSRGLDVIPWARLDFIVSRCYGRDRSRRRDSSTSPRTDHVLRTQGHETGGGELT